MSDIGKAVKNNPCPCGSGKIYSQCCGMAPKVLSLSQARWRKTGRELRRKLGDFADRPSLAREAARAQDMYLASLDPELVDSDDDFIMERCFEWFVFDYMLPSGRTVIQVFRDTHGLGQYEMTLLDDWTKSRVSLYEVNKVFPGKSVVLRNLVNQEVITVQDTSAAQEIDSDTILLIRVLKVGSEFEFSTSGLVLPKYCKVLLLKKLHNDLRLFCRQRGIPLKESWDTYLRDNAHHINAWVTELGYACATPHLLGEQPILDMLSDHKHNAITDNGAISSNIAQRITDAFLDDFYDRWVDRPIPALGGRTPKQACRTATGRYKVEELLRELERVEAERARRGETHYDLNKVRARLGVPGAGEPLDFDTARMSRVKKIEEYQWDNPSYLEVARGVVRGLRERDYSQQQINGALRLWNDYCLQGKPIFRKASVWVATVIYAMGRMELNGEINQSTLAGQYAIASSSISTSFRSLCRTLDLVAFDSRYSSKGSPLDGLREKNPVLAQLFENLKL